MEQIRTYITGIVAVSFLIAIIISLIGGVRFVSPAIKLIGGILLSLTVISPLVNWKISEISSFYNEIVTDAQTYTDEGVSNYNDAINAVITKEAESYILDEARKYSADITVNVSVEEGIPIRISLEGNISPYAKSKLQDTIEKDIGIPKEHQIWN